MTDTTQDLIVRLRFAAMDTMTRGAIRADTRQAADWITAALAREAALRKTLEWVQHNGNFAHRDNIMSVVNNALEVKL